MPARDNEAEPWAAGAWNGYEVIVACRTERQGDLCLVRRLSRCDRRLRQVFRIPRKRLVNGEFGQRAGGLVLHLWGCCEAERKRSARDYVGVPFRVVRPDALALVYAGDHEFKLLRIEAKPVQRCEGKPMQGRSARLLGLLAVEGLVELPQNGIAGTGGGFEAFAIEDADAASLVVDEAAALQSSGDKGDGAATGAEHVGEKLLSEVEGCREAPAGVGGAVLFAA